MHLVLEDMARVTLPYYNNTIFKYRRPEIAHTKDLLCSSITRNVTTIGATMTIIEDFLSFLEAQTSTKNGIQSDTIEGIPDYTIRVQMMTDASAGILCQLRSESRSLEINDDITVPCIEGAN